LLSFLQHLLGASHSAATSFLDLAATLLASDFIITLGAFTCFILAAFARFSIHDGLHTAFHLWRKRHVLRRWLRSTRVHNHVFAARLPLCSTATPQSADMLDASTLFIGSLNVFVGEVVRSKRLVATTCCLAKVHLGLATHDLAALFERAAADRTKASLGFRVQRLWRGPSGRINFLVWVGRGQL
jgi:hypothetical protein